MNGIKYLEPYMSEPEETAEDGYKAKVRKSVASVHWDESGLWTLPCEEKICLSRYSLCPIYPGQSVILDYQGSDKANSQGLNHRFSGSFKPCLLFGLCLFVLLLIAFLGILPSCPDGDKIPQLEKEKGLGPSVDATTLSPSKEPPFFPFCSLLTLMAGKKREKNQGKSHGSL